MELNIPKLSISTFRNFIVDWNNNFPVDYWYRKKYKIPFNSPQHRAISILDMAFEFEEEQLFKRSVKKYDQEKEDERSYKLTGKLLKEIQYTKLTEEEQEDWFDNIDLNDFNKNINTEIK